MSFTAVKEKDCTQIYFDNADKKRYLIFILILFVQVVIVGILGLNYESFVGLSTFVLVISSFLAGFFCLLVLAKKSLRLSQKVLALEYKIFGVLVYKRAYLWEDIQKVAVEFTRLKDYDILFQIKKKFIYLGESLSEENSDSLLKEIQLYHHYHL